MPMCNKDSHSAGGRLIRSGRIFRRFLPAFAALALFAGTDAFPGSPDAVKPPGEALVIRRPEIRAVRKFWQRRPRTAVPKEIPSVFKSPEIRLYEGISAHPKPPGDMPAISGNTEDRIKSDFPLPRDGTGDFPSRISRRPDNRVSLREEMLDLNDLDYGKYGAMAVSEGPLHSNAEGFLHIPIVWTEQPRYNVGRYYIAERDGWAANGLAEAMNRFTNIRTTINPHIYLSSEGIFCLPFLFLSAETAFELTGIERANLGKYLRNGGFLFLDNVNPATEWGPGEASLKKMLRDALGSSARLQPIPSAHSLYHCFFDFTDGPPNGSEINGFNFRDWEHLNAPDYRYGKLSKTIHSLEGVFIGDSLVAVYSNKGYGEKWRQPFRKYQADDQVIWDRFNTPQLKMGVNLVVYALTRECGMTQRVMEQYRDIPD
ncbi:MAG: DUF4159 domain-containing protein [Candidatus Latescibacterota bacterium]